METNEYFTNKEGKEIKRQKCNIYTRIMGYLRPVSSANIGKKTEFYSRKYFNVDNIDNNIILQARANAEFNTKYS